MTSLVPIVEKKKGTKNSIQFKKILQSLHQNHVEKFDPFVETRSQMFLSFSIGWAILYAFALVIFISDDIPLYY